jgi:hypothetical protein
VVIFNPVPRSRQSDRRFTNYTQLQKKKKKWTIYFCAKTLLGIRSKQNAWNHWEMYIILTIHFLGIIRNSKKQR